MSFKTGIASRALKPTLGIVDLNNTKTCPREVAISAGLDVLFHSLESESVDFTFRRALLIDQVGLPCLSTSGRPGLRTPSIDVSESLDPVCFCTDLAAAYQGSNPISDIFSKWALEQTVKYLPRISKDPTDDEARAQML